MRFKAEIVMLLTAIALFTVSTFFYSYNPGLALSLDHPYRSLALPFVSFGSFLMAAATVSYSKRSKNCV